MCGFGRVRRLGVCLVFLSPFAFASSIGAQGVAILSEPVSYTNVIDAFEVGDVFDVHLHLGYRRSHHFALIERELTGFSGGVGHSLGKIANYELERNELLLGIEVGLFHDFAAFAELPLILSDDRLLRPHHEFQPEYLEFRGEPLFELSGFGLRSPTRSGVDSMRFGLAWSPLNQYRMAGWPTWTLIVEGRFNIGNPLRACHQHREGLRCQGQMGEVVQPSDPGIGEGLIMFRAESRASYRTGWLEPYGGLGIEFGWPDRAKQLFVQDGLPGYINRNPPTVLHFAVGLGVIPWEDRGHFQRLAIDLRFLCDFLSEGRGYGPLYDALGSSSHPALFQPVLEADSVESTAEKSPARVPFTGITDIQAHGRLGVQLGLDLRVARYVQFALFLRAWHLTPHFITHAAPCRSVPQSQVGDHGRLVDCHSPPPGEAFIFNPHHRFAIDAPGHRFRASDQWELGLWAVAIAMF
ncbi:MAG: hypothetical protein NZM37_04065 [Sandaracinaceae bacterium]|nr:hypothetical protein [Sandaracinaceae bacterium]